ncbi:hypothetical protein E2C01_062723 [Portunus trituberculatus]|uniref:Uncharacterized protein n=1 Tax=Portunus trituberculatus TaxID=210409 RepID=A0A5B7H772_PORTR|nr:hypothetical protein [Portunus trituberculatus]
MVVKKKSSRLANKNLSTHNIQPSIPCSVEKQHHFFPDWQRQAEVTGRGLFLLTCVLSCIFNTLPPPVPRGIASLHSPSTTTSRFLCLQPHPFSPSSSFQPRINTLSFPPPHTFIYPPPTAVCVHGSMVLSISKQVLIHSLLTVHATPHRVADSLYRCLRIYFVYTL